MKKALCFLMSISFVLSSCDRTVTIVQISDPQLGFYDRYDLSYETGTLAKAVGIVNDIKPDAVVFTGDLVHHPSEERQWQEFIRLASMIDEGVMVHFLPGNHDGIIRDNSFSMEPYVQHIGEDRFSSRIGNVLITGLNTNYIYFGDETDPCRAEQFSWLEDVLSSRKRSDVSVVFGHHPFFVETIDEEDGYFQITKSRRNEYFELFEREGVGAYFGGHLHRNAETSHGEEMEVITTSAVGRPLGQDPSGLRIITIKNGVITHKYVPVD